MEEYKEVSHDIQVPKNTGVEGFLKTLRSILALPHVQTITINASGNVKYTRYARTGEPDAPIAVEYAGLEPWSIIRNGELEEISYAIPTPATTVVAYMFSVLMVESLIPVAFATGANSNFWEWHQRSAGLSLPPRPMAYGLPLYVDRAIPDQTLILCAAYVRGSTLPECHRFLTTSMLTEADLPPPPDTTVNVL